MITVITYSFIVKINEYVKIIGQKTLMKALKGLNPNARNNDLQRPMVKNYVLKVIKG